MSETCKLFENSSLPVKKDLGMPNSDSPLMRIDECPVSLVENGVVDSICVVCPGGRVIYVSNAHTSMDFMSSDRQ